MLEFLFQRILFVLTLQVFLRCNTKSLSSFALERLDVDADDTQHFPGLGAHPNEALALRINIGYCEACAFYDEQKVRNLLLTPRASIDIQMDDIQVGNSLHRFCVSLVVQK